MKDNEVKFPYPNLESIVTKRKKRQRTSTVSETEEKDSRLQYEKDFADGFMKKLSERLDESTYLEVLNLLQNLETNLYNIEEFHNKVDSLLMSHDDLKWEFLAFLQPNQTLESGKLMEFLRISDMKEFVLKLMLHFKKQPHLLKKVIDKLCFLAENEHLLQWDMIEENIASFLPKNSDLMQLFLGLFPSEKPLDKYFMKDDAWEEFNVDHDVIDEETFDASHLSEISHFEPKSCLYGCKNKANTTPCIICDVKYINGRMYIANGRVLRPANIIFDPAEEKEHTKRLCGENDYYVSSTSRPPKVHKRADACNKELNDGGLSPFILGTESEEEIGDGELQQRSKKRKNTRVLKIRLKSKKNKPIESRNDQAHTDDTAPSNDDGSCDDTSKEDNDYNSCDESAMKRVSNDCNSGLPAKEIVSLEDMEFNISACTVTTNRTGENNRSAQDVHKHVKNSRTNLI